MRFWDASALVPIIVWEHSSDAVRRLLASDDRIVAWWGSTVECVSGLRRREREGELDAPLALRALGRLDALSSGWTEIGPSGAVRSAAEHALAAHPLRVGDAFQLAAALLWRGEPTSVRELVCLDRRLRDAAAREGFALLPEELPAV